MSKKIDKNRTLLFKNPELAKEWHPTKNGELTPENVFAGSNKKVWWVCNKGHEWQTTVYIRNAGSGCPYCSSQKVCKDNCLATVNSELAKEWHPAKNRNLTPEDVTFASDKKVWWVCNKGHEWQATVHARNTGTGCPYCSGHKVCKENSLATIDPKLAKEWHPTKNGDLTPENVFSWSKKKVWWICDKGHEWNASIDKRRSGRGCLYCCNQKVCEDNCLATTNPKLAKEWHPTKNGDLTPEHVTSGSGKIVWWKCSCGGEWQAKIATRNSGYRMCPLCKKELKRLGFYSGHTKGVSIRSR